MAMVTGKVEMNVTPLIDVLLGAVDYFSAYSAAIVAWAESGGAAIGQELESYAAG